MTPQAFVEKCQASPKREHVDAQPHFLDLCRLLDVEDPATADPAHEWFTFEKGATKTSGGSGWADVWRKGCFGWEYKSHKADLGKAYQQLLNYSVALENPPLLIVSDMERIVIHTSWTNTVQKVHEFTLPDLTDAANRDRLRAAFTGSTAGCSTPTRRCPWRRPTWLTCCRPRGSTGRRFSAPCSNAGSTPASAVSSARTTPTATRS